MKKFPTLSDLRMYISKAELDHYEKFDEAGRELLTAKHHLERRAILTRQNRKQLGALAYESSKAAEKEDLKRIASEEKLAEQFTKPIEIALTPAHSRESLFAMERNQVSLNKVAKLSYRINADLKTATIYDIHKAYPFKVGTSVLYPSSSNGDIAITIEPLGSDESCVRTYLMSANRFCVLPLSLLKSGTFSQADAMGEHEYRTNVLHQVRDRTTDNWVVR